MISRIATYLPERLVTNDDLATELGDWSAEKIYEKTGIRERRVAGPDQCSSDLVCRAAEKALAGYDRGSVDFLLFCTQTPDYLLPTSACMLQSRLGLPTHCGALDFNLGCSGYIYGLALSSGLMAAGLAERVLLLNGDTYSRYLGPNDKSTRTIFGDGGAATLLERGARSRVHSFVLGTDGTGAEQLILRGSACRPAQAPGGATAPCLEMNGPEVFNFTLGAVPRLVNSVLARAGLTSDQIDLFVFHQANAFMLEHLRRRLAIPADRFVLCLEHYGNTVSATIPLALEQCLSTGRLRPGMRVLLAGFGVGFSWGGCVVDW